MSEVCATDGVAGNVRNRDRLRPAGHARRDRDRDPRRRRVVASNTTSKRQIPLQDEQTGDGFGGKCKLRIGGRSTPSRRWPRTTDS